MRIESLTPRKLKVLALVAEARSSAGVADVLGIPASRSVKALVPVLVLTLLSACGAGSDSPQQAATRDSAGITIVTNPAEDRPLNWSFEPLFVSGSVDGGEDSFVRIPDHSIAPVSNGDILVLDAGARSILKLSSNGEYLATLVTGGDGPEELRLPVGMTVLGDQVVVLDPTRYGTVSFGWNGEFAGHSEFSTEFAGRKIGHWDGRLLFSTLENYRSQADSVVERLLLRGGGESPREFAAVSRPRPQMVRYPDCVSIQFDPLFSPRLTWASNGHRLVHSTSEAYSVAVSEPDGRPLLIRRDLEPREVDAAIALRELGDGKEVRTPRGACPIEPADELEGRGYNDRLPIVDELAVSPSGEIWVQRRAFRGETPRIDVFAPEGIYTGTFEAEADVFPDAFVTDSLILVKTVDELDVEHVTALRVHRTKRGD